MLTEACDVQVTVTVDVVDNCLGNSVTVTNNFDNGGATASGLFGLGDSSITFFAVDACGNLDSCVVNVSVIELVRPSNRCETITGALDANGEFVLDVDSLLADSLIGGEDFCTDVTYSLDLDILDCIDYLDFLVDSLGIAVLTYNLTVTDESGNSSSCNNSIFLSDPLDILSLIHI